MANLALTALCGANASQTITDWVIKKADLASTGLNCPPGSTVPTPKANNSATSLLVAMLEYGADNFTDTAQQANPDINMTIEVSPYSQTDYANNQNYDVTTYNVRVRKLKANTGIDPDDYDV